jgi:hypothetical protein
MPKFFAVVYILDKTALRLSQVSVYATQIPEDADRIWKCQGQIRQVILYSHVCILTQFLIPLPRLFRINVIFFIQVTHFDCLYICHSTFAWIRRFAVRICEVCVSVFPNLCYFHSVPFPLAVLDSIWWREWSWTARTMGLVVWNLAWGMYVCPNFSLCCVSRNVAIGRSRSWRLTKLPATVHSSVSQFRIATGQRAESMKRTIVSESTGK